MNKYIRGRDASTSKQETPNIDAHDLRKATNYEDPFELENDAL